MQSNNALRQVDRETTAVIKNRPRTKVRSKRSAKLPTAIPGGWMVKSVSGTAMATKPKISFIDKAMFILAKEETMTERSIAYGICGVVLLYLLANLISVVI